MLAFSLYYLTGKGKCIMEKEKIDRINELAHKSKETGLTDLEKEEQKALRQEFLAEIKADFRATLESIEFVEESEQTMDEILN